MPSFHGNTIGRGVVLLTPTADGSADQIIKTDGSGNLSFVANSGATGPAGPTGPAGATGATGAVGAVGPPGDLSSAHSLSSNCLLHFEGDNASTTFTDETGKTWTRSGDAQISTAQKKFGNSSGLFDGNGDYISTPYSSDFDFGSGNFTIDFWMRATAQGQSGFSGVVIRSTSQEFYTSFSICVKSGGYDVSFASSASGSSWDICNHVVVGTLTQNVWAHVAVVRSGTNIYTFLNGVPGSTTAVAAKVLYANSAPLLLGGGNYPNTYLAGNIDEFRVAKGVARWTADFSASLPSSAETYIPPLTPGRVPYVYTETTLIDSANMAFSGDTLTVAKIVSSSLTAAASTDLTLTPGTAKNVVFGGNKYPTAAGNAGEYMANDGGGVLSWTQKTQDPNVIINGGFDFHQRGANTSAVTVTDDNYGPDRWIVLTQTAGVSTAKYNYPLDSFVVGPFVGLVYQPQTSAQRMGLLQIVEGSSCNPMRGRQITLQYGVYTTSAQSVRYAILEWRGTTDAVTSDVVKSWTSTTYTADNFFLSNANGIYVLATGSFTTSGSTYTAASAIATPSTSCNNLIVFFWTEDTAAQNVGLRIKEVDLHTGPMRAWDPRPIGVELALCQRYYEKSYAIDTAPGTTASIDGTVAAGIFSTYSSGSVQYKVQKRGTTVVHPYNTNNGTIDQVTQNDDAFAFVDNQAAVAVYGLSTGFTISVNGTLTIGNITLYQWTAESEL